MSVSTTLELKIPIQSLIAPPAQMQRSFVRHLLHEGQIKMPNALVLLSTEDQTWLVDRLIHDAEYSLLLASQLADLPLRQHHWQQYSNLLGYLFHWHEHWTPYHGQLLAILRMVVRRYSPDELTPRQFKLILTLTQRLHTEWLYREDIFAMTHALNDVGLDTLLDLSPSDDSFVDLYQEELG